MKLSLLTGELKRRSESRQEALSRCDEGCREKEGPTGGRHLHATHLSDRVTEEPEMNLLAKCATF